MKRLFIVLLFVSILLLIAIACSSLNRKSDNSTVLSEEIKKFIEVMKKIPTKFYNLDLSDDMIESTEECKTSLYLKYNELMPEIKKCNNDQECTVTGGTKNFFYIAINKNNELQLLGIQNEINEKCFNNESFIFFKAPPIEETVPYCANDGYCEFIFKDDPQDEEEFALLIKITDGLEQKRKEKTVLNEDVWDGIKEEMISDECREVKSKELKRKLNDFGKCEQDIDCVPLFGGCGSINKNHLKEHIETNKKFNEECLPPDYQIYDLHVASSDCIFYCSDDGFCNSIIKTEYADYALKNYTDKNGNYVEEKIYNNGDKELYITLKDENIQIVNVRSGIETKLTKNQEGKTIKYEECLNEICVDKTEEMKKNIDKFLEEFLKD